MKVSAILWDCQSSRLLDVVAGNKIIWVHLVRWRVACANSRQKTKASFCSWCTGEFGELSSQQRQYYQTNGTGNHRATVHPRYQQGIHFQLSAGWRTFSLALATAGVRQPSTRDPLPGNKLLYWTLFVFFHQWLPCVVSLSLPINRQAASANCISLCISPNAPIALAHSAGSRGPFDLFLLSLPDHSLLRQSQLNRWTLSVTL